MANSRRLPVRNVDLTTIEEPARIVRSVQHAARILRALGAASDGLPMSEVARRVHLSKPATYHLLRTLEAEHLVVKDSDLRYRLSWGMYELGSTVIRSVDLVRVARPHVDQLADAVGEVVLIGIVDEGAVLYLDRAASSHATDMLASAGRRTPLHATASGKVLLAFRDDDLLRTVAADGLTPRTSATVVDVDQMRGELNNVRMNGYATCWREFDVSLSSVAAPLIDYTGDTVACLTIAGSSKSVNKRSLPRLLQELLPAAQAISAELGARSATRIVG